MATNMDYIPLELETEQHISYNPLFKSVLWLNKFILYSLMWVKKNYKGEPRTIFSNIFGIFFVLIELLYAMTYDAYWIIQGRIWSIDNGVLSFAMLTIADVCLYSAKIISFLYYSRKFEFPWLSKDFENKDLSSLYKKRISFTNKRLIFFLLFYFSICTTHYSAEFIDGNSTIFDYIWLFCLCHTIYIPVAISQCCSSLIFLKYELNLHTLQHTIKVSNNVDYSMISDEYKKMLFSFKKESKFWTVYFGVKFFGFFCFIWQYLSDLIHGIINTETIIFSVVGIVFWLSPFIELCISSSKLSSEYKQLCTMLLMQLNNEEKQINSDIHSFQQIYAILKRNKAYNFCYNFVIANPLCFRLFGWELHAQNAIKLMFFFIIAKIISYSIQNI